MVLTDLEDGPEHGAVLTDLEDGPEHGAVLTDLDDGPEHGAVLTDLEDGPEHGAVLTDLEDGPEHGAVLTDLEDGSEHGRVVDRGAVPAAVAELVLTLGDAGPRAATHAAHMVLPTGQVRSRYVRSEYRIDEIPPNWVSVHTRMCTITYL